MTRILLLAVLALFVMVALRRAFAAGRASNLPPQRPRGQGMSRDDARPKSGRSPQQLVCGACGQDFDPEESGWILSALWKVTAQVTAQVTAETP